MPKNVMVLLATLIVGLISLALKLNPFDAFAFIGFVLAIDNYIISVVMRNAIIELIEEKHGSSEEKP